MELEDKQFPHKQKYAAEVIELAAGNKIRIQKWNAQDGLSDVLAETTVPAGKSWSVSIIMDISETDV